MQKLMQTYINKVKNALDNLDLNEVEVFANLLSQARKNKNNVFIMGNGGSAMTASHFACDFNKGIYKLEEENNRFRFVCLNDSISTISAYSNDMDYSDIFVEQLKNFLQEGDLVVCLSGSGNSKNVLKAVEFANKQGATTIGITGYDGGKLKQLAKHNICTNVCDMQISEDIHLIICHLVMKIFNCEL